MTAAEKYLAAAYLVVFVFVLAYVLIIAAKLQRLERELDELAALARRRALEPEREEAAKPPVREADRGSGLRGNREVPPLPRQGAMGG